MWRFITLCEIKVLRVRNARLKVSVNLPGLFCRESKFHEQTLLFFLLFKLCVVLTICYKGDICQNIVDFRLPLFRFFQGEIDVKYSFIAQSIHPVRTHGPEKAFDSIHRESLGKIMRSYGIPEKLINTIK